MEGTRRLMDEAVVPAFRHKVVSMERLRAVLEGQRTRGRKIVLTNGCFDLLHAGHAHYLEQAKGLGDFLVVGVNSDRSVRQLNKPGAPSVPEQQRAQLLAALGCVDAVVIFDELRAVELIKTVRPDFYVKGGDYTIDTIVQEERRSAEDLGAKVMILAKAPSVSSTSLRERAKQERAALLARIKRTAYLEGDFVLSSGKRSRYYLDKYLLETDPALLEDIASGMAAMLPEATDRLAGVELGGVALAAAVALKTGLPFVIVRREAKEHGTAKEFEGKLEAGDRVALVEDIATTGRQAVQAARKLEKAGAKVAAVLCIVDRQEGAAEAMAEAGYDFRPLCSAAELGIPPQGE
jgi:orotate phosphoribosyltransferase